ncbi:CDP-glycerol:glycerophosphate glycerophosphotransferase [Staphylococcus xylosus]|uniref:bifunctional glycosyltransferase family 2 protein/CDP-glycerol:glycerophosphate glycerophosphotransferase n=1 Tax=Staphylococcus xylosus TaxID=1288 RepID=UPI0033650F2C
MYNQLTIIVPFYNNETHLKQCLESLINQSNQQFELILVNDGAQDLSENYLFEKLETYSKQPKYIKLDKNHGHAYARNKGIAHVETPYFMFVDADDIISPYTIEVYLKHLKQQDAVISKIHDFSLNIPNSYLDEDLTVHYKKINKYPDALLKQDSISNIIFKTSIVQNHCIKLNENLNIYADWSFILEYNNYAETFIHIEGVPFYFCGEIYDPFTTEKLRAQPFESIFPDYIDAFKDAIQRVNKLNNKKSLKKFILQHMVDKLHIWFEPNNQNNAAHYQFASKMLAGIIPMIKPALKSESPLFNLELRFIQFGFTQLAIKLNYKRYRLRFYKAILLNKPNKHYAKYVLFNKNSDVSQQTVVFESFGGSSYNDSPKYIYEYMKSHYPNFHYYWVFRDTKNIDIPEGVKPIQKQSAAYYDIYKKAHVWVSNARLPLFIKKKSNQLYIQVWHGTPLKFLANDMTVVRMPNTTTATYKKYFYESTRRWDYLVSPNAYSTTIFQSAFWMARNQILEIGYPRNDLLINHQHDQELHRKIKDKLGIPSDKKVILYAPTWRDDEYSTENKYISNLKLDINQLRNRLGDTYIVLFRMHYLISNELDLSQYTNFAIDVSKYNDISELYLISDCLITDYSSVMFDFGILKRPQIFYAYDMEKYSTDLRGFYFDYLNDLPGPIYTNTEDLIAGLENIKQIEQHYQPKINQFYNRFCVIENGKASQHLGDLIANRIQNTDNKI